MHVEVSRFDVDSVSSDQEVIVDQDIFYYLLYGLRLLHVVAFCSTPFCCLRLHSGLIYSVIICLMQSNFRPKSLFRW